MERRGNTVPRMALRRWRMVRIVTGAVALFVVPRVLFVAQIEFGLTWVLCVAGRCSGGKLTGMVVSFGLRASAARGSRRSTQIRIASSRRGTVGPKPTPPVGSPGRVVGSRRGPQRAPRLGIGHRRNRTDSTTPAVDRIRVVLASDVHRAVRMAADPAPYGGRVLAVTPKRAATLPLPARRLSLQSWRRPVARCGPLGGVLF
jgi:hypothetical protein